jgi:Asp/Glu/hydantoin racemase
MSRSVAFIHTSPAAIAPVKAFFAAAAPSLTITNLLDDGILRMFAASDYTAVEAQLGELISLCQRVYAAEVALITCSAVPRDSMGRIRTASPVPVLKIDDPMAEAAVRAGRRIGVLYTFAPTLKPTTALLQSASMDAGVDCEIQPKLVAGAYDALLTGRASEHDELVLEAAEHLAANADVVMIAQVSMAHLADAIEARTLKPALSSLSTSLEALRRIMGGF